jgi:putative inorganic carbon (HCO3(-)) transporter
MRDILITFIVLVGCVYTIKRPYIGVLLWSWLSYMNPHRLAYGFSYSMPFSQITAITLFFAIPFSKETQKIPLNIITKIWFFFILWMSVTTVFSYFPEDAFNQYVKIIKIQLVVFLTILLITDIEKLRKLIFVVVLSIGYYSVKGGLFTILTGGGDKVWGPPESFIEGNNELAVAALMVIPLMAYLYQTLTNKWLKKGMLVAMPLSFVSALGTQSRGALIAFAAVALFFWIKSSRKLIIGVVITVFSLVLISFMPESWHQRMDTIKTYEEDASAMGRLNAWEYAYNAANHNFFGVGLDAWSQETFALYAPNPFDVHAAHSIYFTVLADHGWVGLILFLSIFFLSWRSLNELIKNTTNNDQFKEINLLSKMIQVGFIAYLVGGTFLSLSYFDLPWHYISFVILLNKFYDKSKVTPKVAVKRDFYHD